MIKSSRAAEIEQLFRLHGSKRVRAIERVALRRLDLLGAPPDLAALAAIPGNRLERLHGDRKGQHNA